MQFTDLSQSQDIGATCQLLVLGPFRILIDCGLDPKKTGSSALPNLDFLGDQSLDFVILTHAHLDHIGSLPLLVSKFPKIPILTSQATSILGPRMLHNSYNVMRRQCDEGLGKDAILYTKGQVEAVSSNWHCLALGKANTFYKGPDSISITLYASGHIAGAIGCSIEYKDKRIFITADMLFEDQLTIPGASFPRTKHNILITETTRGLTLRSSSRKDEATRLVKTIAQTMERGGYCLLPLFALGRLQEVLSILHEAIFKHKTLSLYPIFASGLGLEIAGYMDEIAQKTKSIFFRRKIIKDLKLKRIQGKLKPGQLPSKKGIYLLSSGMMLEHTPSYALAASIMKDPNSLVAFSGYCDPESPGGKILKSTLGQTICFEAYNYNIARNIAIESFDLSAHADREHIIDFAKQLNPEHIIVTHGSLEAKAWFLEEFSQKLPNTRLSKAIPGNTIDL